MRSFTALAVAPRGGAHGSGVFRAAKTISLQCSDLSLFLLVMVTPFSVRLIIPGVTAVVGGGHPDFDADAASIERSVGTKHPSYVGRDGIGTPNLPAR